MEDFNQAPTSTLQPAKKSMVKKPMPVLLILIIVLLISSLGLAYYQTRQLSDTKKSVSGTLADTDKRLTALEAPAKYVQGQVEKDKFQAVFLNGGQVYFGKITHIDDNTLTLENIYYLKTGQYQQGGAVVGDTSLIKLGNELHGPEDKMVIERKNATFWENLKSDGQVAKAIAAYEKTH